MRFDLNGVAILDSEGVPRYLSLMLEDYEREYNISRPNDLNTGYFDFAIRFRRLIKAASEATGLEVVILIDEYEKPILDTIGEPELRNRHRGYLKSFYGILNNMEEYIHFVLLTRVTHMCQMSIFSDLDHLHNISSDPEFATICGFTKEEIVNNFMSYVSELFQRQGWNYEKAIEELRKKYDGYSFTDEDIKVYNPFNLLKS